MTDTTSTVQRPRLRTRYHEELKGQLQEDRKSVV